MNCKPAKKSVLASAILAGCGIFAFSQLMVLAAAEPDTLAASPVLTKVSEVRQLARRGQSITCSVRLEGILLWTSSDRDQMILHDDSGAMRVELDLRHQPPLQTGQRVLLEGSGLAGSGGLREALVNNDGYHPAIEKQETLFLAAGRHPIRLEWFNAPGVFRLEVAFQGPELPRQRIPDSALFRAKVNSNNGTSNWVQGLNYRCYEGDWGRLPDFRHLSACKTGTVSNFDLGVRTRDQNVGLEFTGFLEVTRPGHYTFWNISDDGSRFFIDEFLQLSVLGAPLLPTPVRIFPGQALTEEQDFKWVTSEGTITFVGERSGSLDLELRSGTGTLHIDIADGSGSSPKILLNSRVRVSGVCQNTFTSDGERVAATILATTLKQIEFLEPAPAHWTDCPIVPISRLARANFIEAHEALVHVCGKVRSFKPGESLLLEDGTGEVLVETTQPPPGNAMGQVEALGRWSRTGTNLILRCGFYREMARSDEAITALPHITSIEQIKSLSREEAQQGCPVKIRGVITAATDGGFFIQNATWSIYVRWKDLILSDTPRAGDYWEVEGVTFAEFAPNIRAKRAVRLGPGILPEPLHPTWDQLINGSLDSRYIEIQGVVIVAEPDGMELLTRAGKIKVQLSDVDPLTWKRYENALISVRGCAIPGRDDDTQQVQLGHLWLCNSSVNVDEPAPTDPFNAPLKRASDLLQFDSRASALQRVKMTGQILHKRGSELFFWEGARGVRILPRKSVQLKAGDKVEVVGFPDLSGPSPVLHEAYARRTGHDVLPLAEALSGEPLLSGRHDATLVRMQARLTDISTDRSDQILTLQAGAHGFVARLNTRQGLRHDLLPGSRLEISGVYAGQGGDPASGRDISSFELLLNSPGDITVLERPGWWTLRRLFAALGVIAVVLVGAMLWALTLKRQVNAQTKLIHDKIETEATLEERARIARELHDTLEQALAATSFQLNALAGSLTNLPKNSLRLLEMARSMVRHAQEESRRTVRNLRLLALEKHDLQTALAQLATQSGDGLPVDIQISVTGTPRPLSSHVESHLLRIGQEATNNAIKYARASAIRLNLDYGAGWIQLTVSDDGCGFDTSHAVPTEAGHFGLPGMRERADKMGGSLKIFSASGKGTIIQVKVPLSNSTLVSSHSNSNWK